MLPAPSRAPSLTLALVLLMTCSPACPSASLHPRCSLVLMFPLSCLGSASEHGTISSFPLTVKPEAIWTLPSAAAALTRAPKHLCGAKPDSHFSGHPTGCSLPLITKPTAPYLDPPLLSCDSSDKSQAPWAIYSQALIRAPYSPLSLKSNISFALILVSLSQYAVPGGISSIPSLKISESQDRWLT